MINSKSKEGRKDGWVGRHGMEGSKGWMEGEEETKKDQVLTFS